VENKVWTNIATTMAARAHDTYRTGERRGTTFSDETSPDEEVSSLLAVVVEGAVE